MSTGFLDGGFPVQRKLQDLPGFFRFASERKLTPLRKAALGAREVVVDVELLEGSAVSFDPLFEQHLWALERQPRMPPSPSAVLS